VQKGMPTRVLKVIMQNGKKVVKLKDYKKGLDLYLEIYGKKSSAGKYDAETMKFLYDQGVLKNNKLNGTVTINLQVILDNANAQLKK
jgi:hypothetical protein